MIPNSLIDEGATAPASHATRSRGARDRLRAATAGAHHELDTRLSRLDLNAPHDYHSFIRVHVDALPAIERALEAAGVERLCADWPTRRRREALLSDAAALGIGEGPREPRSLVAGDPEIVGTLYVLEGSRLGGEMLARSIRGGTGMPTAFLDHGRGARLWTSFLPLLEGTLVTERDRERAAAAALRAFAAFEKAARSVIEGSV